MNERIAANRALWNELTEIHQRPSELYDVEQFKAGGTTLRPIELAEVGDVRGKSLLHLQCHFGLDTLSWARLGARVTGVDISDVAIARARELAAECGLAARFVCADLDALDDLGEAFDIVFTSFGTTIWLPDLDRWARLIARSLAPGGLFYIIDGHPFSRCIGPDLAIVESYFHDGPRLYDGGFPDYAVPDAVVSAPSCEWSHTLGAIVTALASAGLRIAFLHEHPFSYYPFLPDMQRGDDGYYRRSDPAIRIAHMYSLKATR